MKRIAVLLVTAGFLFSAAAVTTASVGADTTRVWVGFETGGKAAVGQALRQSGGEIHYEFDELGAFAVTVPTRALAGLSRNPNVSYIEEDPRRYMAAQTVPYGIVMVQADQVSDAHTGNRTVCVIDSGYYLGHEDLPSGSNVTGSANGGAGVWYQDGSGHGTHVTGTIAALNNDVGVVGVAPNGNLNIHVVRVFNDGGSWAYSSGLAAALGECRNAGANVVNMSLSGSMKSRSEEIAFNNAYAAGVLSIGSAGNAGNNRHAYPASYDSVISVAAIDENKVVASFSQQTNQVELSAPGVNVLSTVPMGTGAQSDLTVAGTAYDNAAMDGSPQASASGSLVDCGLGTSTCSAAAGGAVCLISRGEISFADKVLNCQAGGGSAAVIYNNEAGMLYGTLGDVNTNIPSVGITQSDGQFLLSDRLGSSTTVSLTASNYAHFNGTSMSAPHVSGVAALVWSHYTSCTNADVRNAMTATAEDLGPAGRDNAYGYGLVRAKAALDYLSLQTCAGGDGGGDNGGGDNGGGDNGGGDDDPPPSCGPAGTSCTTADECCNNCTGRPGQRTCN